MGIQTQHFGAFTYLSSPLVNFCTDPPSKPFYFSRKPFNFNPFSDAKTKWSRDDSWFGANQRKNLCSWNMQKQKIVFSSAEELNGNTDSLKKRKVVEHICLLKAKEDLSDEAEKDMLDYLYTTQYHMRGIVAISLGRVSDRELAKYTHAIYMRFQKKEDLTKFYENPFYVGVLRDHVFPYCHVRPNMTLLTWIMNQK